MLKGNHHQFSRKLVNVVPESMEFHLMLWKSKAFVQEEEHLINHEKLSIIKSSDLSNVGVQVP